MKKIVLGIILTLLLTSMLMLTYNVQPVRAEPRTWTVDDDGPADFDTIQEAISAASSGDMIYVYDGTYNESLTIDKDSLTVVGEKRKYPFIRGQMRIYANSVKVEGFTISPVVLEILEMEFATEPVIKLENANETKILDNIIKGYTAIVWGVGWPWPSIYHECGIGIQVEYGINNVIRNNKIDECYVCIYLYGTKNHRIVANDFRPSEFWGKMAVCLAFANDTVLYYNNFYGWCWLPHTYGTTWDNGYPWGGNYWYDYNGTDLFRGPYQNVTGSDGIGDTPYVIDESNVDRYPLIFPCQPITITGDVNHDANVNIIDIVLVASIYGCKEGEPNWNPEADMAAPYGKIDILDLVTCATHYGEKYP